MIPGSDIKVYVCVCVSACACAACACVRARVPVNERVSIDDTVSPEGLPTVENDGCLTQEDIVLACLFN